MLTVVRRGGTSREKPSELVRGQVSRLPWAWAGLCFAVPFNDATRDSARDLVFNAAPSAALSLNWTQDNRGNPVARLGIPSWVTYADSPIHTKPSTAITIYVRMRRAGTPDPGGGIFCKAFAAQPSGWESWSIRGSSLADNTIGTAITFDTDHADLPSTYVLSSSTWANVFVRWYSGNVVKMDILGERGETLSSVATGGAYTGTISYGAGGDPIRINTDNTATNSFNTEYSQTMVWSRCLTDTEIQALISDPYGWYSPRRETVGVSSPYPLYGGQSFMREVSSG